MVVGVLLLVAVVGVGVALRGLGGARAQTSGGGRRRWCPGGGWGGGEEGVVSSGDCDWGKAEERENYSAISGDEEVGQHCLF